MQQSGGVKAASDLAAEQGQGARGLWLSEKRQTGSPGESALSFSTNTPPISVGAQRVRQGFCPGQGGRIQRGHYFTQTNHSPGPHQGFISHHFVVTQIVQKQSQVPLGEGVGQSGLCCLGAQASNHRGRGGPDCQQGRR